MRKSVAILLITAIAGLAGCKKEGLPVPIGLPAGASLHATVLSGVDVPVNVTVSKNPAGIAFAVDPAQLGRSDGQCQVIGAAAGDLHSERVAVRARTLNCTFRSGSSMTVPILAIAVDEDTKTGLRGTLTAHKTEPFLQVPAGRKVSLILLNAAIIE